MSYIMGLEGQQVRALDQIRGELYGVMPRPMRRASVALNGITDPFTSHKLLTVAGILFGMWLSSSPTGRSWVKSVRGR